MNWPEIRSKYPNQWLLLEAQTAHSRNDKRLLEDLSVVDTFQNSASALQRYASLHHQAPSRELYVFHTSRDQLDVTERLWLGMRLTG